MEMQTAERDDRSILIVSGRFDAHAVPEFQQWIAQVANGKTPRAVVNLKGATFLDTPALAALVNGMKRCREKDGDLVLCSLQDPVRIIFELTRLEKAFNIYADEDAAVAA